MPDNPQTTLSGAAELKNYYDNNDSIYEAIKRRRRKRMEEQGLDLNDNEEEDQYPNPNK